MAIHDLPKELLKYERSARKKRLQREHEARISLALDHYATTQTPVANVARYLGITEKIAEAGLRARGRIHFPDRLA